MIRSITDKQYLGVALPFMISTMTQPLMGAVNTAMMGRFPDPAYISGVALGAVLFNTIYWFFGFLRVGTTGYAAQALGSGRAEDQWTSFGRPLVVALAASIVILVLQKPIVAAYISFIKPEPDVEALLRRYYSLLIWGTPATLFNYVALGWLMGQARLRASLFQQVSTNLLNILLCIIFVKYLNHDIGGVAAASLISLFYGSLISIWLMKIYGGFKISDISTRLLFHFRSLTEMMSTNGNLMFRTACLLMVNNLFAEASSSFGKEILAANAVLLQIISIMSYLIDGMANANSLFSGRAVGRADQALFEETRRMCFKWLTVLAFILFALYWAGRGCFINIFTDNESILLLAGNFDFYILLYPFCAGIGISMYGMYTGATATAPIRDMMLIAMLIFTAARAVLIPLYGNDGLWTAYLMFYASQSAVILLFYPRLRKKTGFLKPVF